MWFLEKEEKELAKEEADSGVGISSRPAAVSCSSSAMEAALTWRMQLSHERGVGTS